LDSFWAKRLIDVLYYITSNDKLRANYFFLLSTLLILAPLSSHTLEYKSLSILNHEKFRQETYECSENQLYYIDNGLCETQFFCCCSSLNLDQLDRDSVDSTWVAAFLRWSCSWLDNWKIAVTPVNCLYSPPIMM